MKLTEKQKSALRHVHSGDVQKHRFGYGAWRITGPAQPTVIGRLIAMGLVRWVGAPQSNDAEIAFLTEAGLAEFGCL